MGDSPRAVSARLLEGEQMDVTKYRLNNVVSGYETEKWRVRAVDELMKDRRVDCGIKCILDIMCFLGRAGTSLYLGWITNNGQGVSRNGQSVAESTRPRALACS